MLMLWDFIADRILIMVKPHYVLRLPLGPGQSGLNREQSLFSILRLSLSSSVNNNREYCEHNKRICKHNYNLFFNCYIL